MLSKKVTISSELKQLDHISLLEQVCNEENVDAYHEFVNRFYDDVLEQCKTKCKVRNVDLHVGEQIAHETFERVLKYKSFNKTKLNQAKDVRKAIISWLNRCVLNLFYDYHNSLKVDTQKKSSYFDDLAEIGKELSIDDLTLKKELALIIYNKLNKKEKEVVLTDIEYKRGKKYLPHDVNETLATKLEVKVGSVRKIRQRAIKKIKQALIEINER